MLEKTKISLWGYYYHSMLDIQRSLSRGPTHPLMLLAELFPQSVKVLTC